MGCTVRELLSRIDSHELSEWLAYFRIEPLDDAHYHTALICSTLINLWSDKKVSPEDIFPWLRRLGDADSAEHTKAVLLGLSSKAQ